VHHWANKHWGALIGALVVISAGLVGVGLTALAILVAILGYFIGKFLDGELSLRDIQDRAQGRTRSPQQDQSPPRPPRVD
jgi:uncharacterized protein YcfJ